MGTPITLRSAWELLRDWRTDFDRIRGHTDEEVESFIDRWHQAQGLLLQAPIRSYDDAIAKLEAAATLAKYGVRDDYADADAVDEVVHFLKAANAAPEMGPMMKLLAQRNRLADWINAEPCWGPERETERDHVHDAIVAMENCIIDTDSGSLDALAAKVQLFLKLDEEGAQLVQEVTVEIMKGVAVQLRGSQLARAA